MRTSYLKRRYDLVAADGRSVNSLRVAVGRIPAGQQARNVFGEYFCNSPEWPERRDLPVLGKPRHCEARADTEGHQGDERLRYRRALQLEQRVSRNRLRIPHRFKAERQ